MANSATLAVILEGKNKTSAAVNEAKGGLEGLKTTVSNFGKEAMKAGALMSAGITAPLTLIGKQAISTAADFESQMNVLGLAAKGAGASMEELSRSALKVGSDAHLVGISASEAADAMTAFYKSGLDTNQIMGDMQGYLAGTAELGGTLRSAIDLAAASELDLAQASDLVTVAMKTFGIDAAKASSIADSFVRAADASTASVADLGQALSTVGPTAAAMGISLDDVNVAMALLSERGIAGAEAGTALKSMLVNLQRPTKDVQSALRELGVSLFDATGNMRSLPAILGDLQSSLNGVATTTTLVGGRTEEQNQQLKTAEAAYKSATNAIYAHTAGLKTLSEKELAKVTEKQAAANREIERLSAITGDAVTSTHQLTQEQRLQYIQTLAGTYGMNAMNSLLAAGSEGWDAMAEAVASATSAQETAGARTQGMQAAMEQLQGAVESLMITAMMPFLKETITPLIQKLGDFISNLSQANPELLRMGVIVAALAAAAGPALLVVGALATGLAALLSPIGLVIVAVVALVAAIATDFGGIRSFLQPAIDAFKTFFEVISWGIEDGWSAAEWIEVLSTKFPALGTVINGLVVVVGGFVAVLMNLPETIRTLVNEWSTQLTMLRLVVETAFQGVADIIRSIMGIIISSVQDHATQIRSQFDQAYNTVRTTVQQVLAQIQNIISTVLGIIKTFLARHGDEIRTTLGNAWESLARIINLAAQLVQATVVPIFQAIAQFLSDHGEAIQTVLSGAWDVVKNLIEGVLTLIEGIITAALQVIHGDWEGAWETIKDTVDKVWQNILGIIEGLLTQLQGIYKLGIEELVNKAKKWMDDTLDKVKKGWDDIKTKTAEKLDKLKEKVQEKFNEILDWLRGLPGQLVEIGASMIQGIIDGVKSMAGALWDAVTGVVNSALAGIGGFVDGIVGGGDKAMETVGGAMRAAGREMISTAETIGSDMLAGLAQGLAEQAAMVVEALREIMGEVKLEAVQGAADFVQAVENILSGLASMVEAVSLLTTASLPAGDIAKTVDALIVMMQVAITRMQAAAKLFKLEAVQAAADLAQAGGTITSQLKSMVDGFTAVAGYAAPVIGPTLNTLFDQLHGVIFKLSKLLGIFKSDGLAAAVELAQAGGAITGQLRNMVDGFTAVGGYEPVVIGPALNTLFDQLHGVIFKLSKLVPVFEGEGLTAAAALAQAGGTITGQLKNMVDGFTAVAGYAAPVIGPALNALFSDLRLVLIELGALAASSELGDTEAMAVLAGRIQQLVGFLQPAIAALTALATYAQAVDLAEPIGRLMADLAVVAGAIVFGLRGMGRDVLAGLEEAAPQTEALGRLVGFVRGSIDALNALAGYGREEAADLAAQTALFMADLALTAREIVFGLRSMGRDVLASVEEAAPTAELIGRLVSFVRGGIDAILALAEYKAAEGLPAAVSAFVTDILVVARALQAGLGSLSEQLTAAYDGAIAFAERIGRLVAVVRPGIDAITALAEYQGALGLPARVRAFVTDVLALASELRVGLGSLSAPLLKAYDGAIEFAERIARIVAVVRPGIDAIAAVAGYQAATDLPAAVRAFGRDVVAMASELRLAFGSLTEPLATAFDGAIEFADRIARIVAVVQPGIEAIKAVLLYTAAQGLAAKVRAFAADVLLVAEELRLGLGTPSEEMLAAYDAAATWTTKISAILALIQPAMAALQELSRYGGGAATALHAGMEKLTRNVASLINFLSSHYQVLGGDAVAQAQTFAESIVAIVTAIRRGLEDAASIEGLNATYDGSFVVGQNWITGIVDGITSRLSDLEDLMAYIRGLFPSSPAKYGPWTDLPMGNEVAQRWLAGMSREMQRTSELERSLAGVRGLYAGAGSGAYAGPPSTGSGYGFGGGSVTVNVSMMGPFNVRQDADIEQIAQRVGDVLAQKAGLTRRMGLQRV